MTDTSLTLVNSSGRQTVSLSAYLDSAARQRAAVDALAWIKHLRQLRVDGDTFRDRFLHRGDSLWWFSEIYLHKQRVVQAIFESAAALEALITRETPDHIHLERGDVVACALAPQAAAAHNVAYSGAQLTPGRMRRRLLALESRAAWLHTTALASRLRRARAEVHRGRIAAFVHRAFFRRDADEGSAEAYIGPVLTTLERNAGTDALAYITLGPAENFSARRWWRSRRNDVPGLPIESLADLECLKPSRDVWRTRHLHRTALWTSADFREASVIGGYDCFPLIREELAGIASLQWPWSARAMDEAGAALDALAPAVVLTYAEAGGWGRALMLECRRRGIPSVGLQHGFIYRHWLNYLHEPDEMVPEATGYPRPTLTLVFDSYTEAHLSGRGNFPPDSLLVTGSPRLDQMSATAQARATDDILRARKDAGAADKTLVLVVTKFREARAVLPELIAAAGRLEKVHLAIKTHPAETPDVYAPFSGDRTHVTVLPASAPLAPLVAASRAVVTVNSTVALDAAVLGVPALVVDLPNNLSPFVDAGIMAGADDAGIERALGRILYDEEFRKLIDERRRAFLRRYRIGSDGKAATRSADAVLRLAGLKAP